ncbi:MAG: MOMP family protein [Chlamydiales bacterium]|nr:MOMP family protein [Chlamydiales bacterium]
MKRYLLLLIVPLLCFAHEGEKAPSFPRPPEKEITVEAQPWVKNCIAEPYVEADFLYWKVAEEGLAYAATGFGDPNAPLQYRGKVYDLDFEGALGLRVGLGLNLAHDGWDLFLRYTWMYSNASDSVTADPNKDPLRPIWFTGPDFLFSGGLESASARWDIHFNVVDLEWGRNFYISRFLTLRPFFGLKGYWMDQTYKVRQVGPVQGLVATHRIKSEKDNWGLGIRFGMDTCWYFVKNWSVFADFALTNSWSRYDHQRKDHLDYHVSGETNTQIHLIHDAYDMIPILELGTGVRWEMWFAEDQMHALIQAGWEEQVWWGDNHFLVAAVNDYGKGNLMTQGLTLRFRFDF